MQKETKKKGDVNTLSLVDLKAELFGKQEEFRNQKLQNQNASYIKGKPSGASNKKPGIFSKKNTGVAKRAEKDFEEKKEEEDIFERSKKALESKARLYEKITGGKEVPDGDGSDLYLVDFQKKVIDDVMERGEKERKEKEDREEKKADRRMLNVPVPKAENAEEEWVDYVDSLGRPRRCLIKNLAELQDADKRQSKNEDTPGLLSDDMRREMARKQWEKEETEKMEKEKEGLIHYADVHLENNHFQVLHDLLDSNLTKTCDIDISRKDNTSVENNHGNGKSCKTQNGFSIQSKRKQNNASHSEAKLNSKKGFKGSGSKCVSEQISFDHAYARTSSEEVFHCDREHSYSLICFNIDYGEQNDRAKTNYHRKRKRMYSPKSNKIRRKNVNKALKNLPVTSEPPCNSNPKCPPPTSSNSEDIEQYEMDSDKKLRKKCPSSFHNKFDSGSQNEITQYHSILDYKEVELMSICNKYNVQYDFPTTGESKYEQRLRLRRINYRIKKNKQSDSKTNENDLITSCRKMGIVYESPRDNETKIEKQKRQKRIKRRIYYKRKSTC